MKNIENKLTVYFRHGFWYKGRKNMRKFWGLVLFGLLFANNTLAAGVTDAGLRRENCSQVIDNPESMFGWMDEAVSFLKLYEYSPYKEKKEGDVACATSEYLYYKTTGSVATHPGRRIKTCITCPSGYGIATVMAINESWDCLITYDICVERPTCPSECPSQTEWTSISTGMEAKCLIQSGVGGCMKRCKEGYYQTWKRWELGDFPGDITCKPCPENAVPCTTDLDGNRIKCEQNYYRIDNAPSTSSYVDMECIRCPYYGAVPTVTSGTGATSVNRCYVPNTQHMRDGAGNEFRFKSNCYYTGDYDPDGNYPVSTHPKPID